MLKSRLFKFIPLLKRAYLMVDLYIYRNFIDRKFSFIFSIGILILLLSITACHISSTPEQIYGIRGKIITLAESLKGIKYTYGGTDIYGFDCSGFVHYVFDSFGVKTPRTAKKQRKAGKIIRLSKSQSGDILIFKLEKSWHSGILKKNRNNITFVHAPNKRGVVREEVLEGYWLKKLKYVVKVL